MKLFNNKNTFVYYNLKKIKRLILYYYRPIIYPPLWFDVFLNFKLPLRYTNKTNFKKERERKKLYKLICKNMDWKVKYRKGEYILVHGGKRIYFKNYNPADNLKEVYGYFRHYKIKPSDNIIDGGGFVGLFSLMAAKFYLREGIVIAFEANPEIYKELVLNISNNNLNRNIIPVNIGLYSNKTILKFVQEGANSRLEIYKNSTNNDETEIAVDSIDSQIKRLGINKIDFIKMDIEGAEIEAIKGAKETLKRNNLSLAIATYHILNNEQTYVKVEIILAELGYNAFTEYPRHLTTYAKKK